jgi:hypothetical protein
VIVGLIKQDLRFQYLEAPGPFQVFPGESRQGGVDVPERGIRVLVAQRPENPIVDGLQLNRRIGSMRARFRHQENKKTER